MSVFNLYCGAHLYMWSSCY